MHKPKQGQIYLLKKDEDGKQRPVLIISRSELNGGHSVSAVPFYSQQLEKRKNQPWCAFFHKGEGGLLKDCVAKPDEMAPYDKTYIDFARGKVGEFDEHQIERVLNALRWAVNDPNYVG